MIATLRKLKLMFRCRIGILYHSVVPTATSRLSWHAHNNVQNFVSPGADINGITCYAQVEQKSHLRGSASILGDHDGADRLRCVRPAADHLASRSKDRIILFRKERDLRSDLIGRAPIHDDSQRPPNDAISYDYT